MFPLDMDCWLKLQNNECVRPIWKGPPYVRHASRAGTSQDVLQSWADRYKFDANSGVTVLWQMPSAIAMLTLQRYWSTVFSCNVGIFDYPGKRCHLRSRAAQHKDDMVIRPFWIADKPPAEPPGEIEIDAVVENMSLEEGVAHLCDAMRTWHDKMSARSAPGNYTEELDVDTDHFNNLMSWSDTLEHGLANAREGTGSKSVKYEPTKLMVSVVLSYRLREDTNMNQIAFKFLETLLPP